jgi:hypothetical protein
MFDALIEMGSSENAISSSWMSMKIGPSLPEPSLHFGGSHPILRERELIDGLAVA